MVDSAFNITGQGANYMYKSSQSSITSNDPLEYARNSQATSVRQAAEWGMKALQNSFPRLKSTLKYEEHGERQMIIKSIVLLYNLRSRLVGLNKISTVFNPLLSEEALLTFQRQS